MILMRRIMGGGIETKLPDLPAVLFLFLPAVFVACPSSSPQTKKSPVPASRSSFFAGLERDFADIAEDCKDNLNCYWEEGHDHIEFNACRGAVLALFGSLTECHEDSISTLEDLAVELDLIPKKTRRRRRSRRRRSPSNSGGNSGSEPSSVTLNRELYDRICGQPGVQCRSYDELLGLSGSDLCSQPANIRVFFSGLSCEGDGNGEEPSTPPVIQPVNPVPVNPVTPVPPLPPVPPPTPAECPASNPPSGKKLTDMTFGGPYRTNVKYKYQREHCYAESSATFSRSNAGTATPATNEILFLYSGTGFSGLYLNAGAITNFDSSHSWYVYIDGTRHTLTHQGGGYTCSAGSNHHHFSTVANIFSSTASVAVHLAYKPSGSDCVFVQ